MWDEFTIHNTNTHTDTDTDTDTAGERTRSICTSSLAVLYSVVAHSITDIMSMIMAVIHLNQSIKGPHIATPGQG